MDELADEEEIARQAEANAKEGEDATDEETEEVEPPEWEPRTDLERSTDAIMREIGAEHTDEDLPIEGVNPHYAEGRQWRENCQRCVPAYEARLRGYDVEARPSVSRNDLFFRLPRLSRTGFLDVSGNLSR